MRVNDERDAPSPQQLAAYLDGELDAATHARVADWLARHPAAAAALEAQGAVEQNCRAAPPPPPSEAAWDALLNRIDERTQIIRGRQRRAARPAWCSLVLRFAAVAAVLVAVLLGLRHFPDPAPVPMPAPPPEQVTKRLPVAGDDDVEIVSMDAADMRAVIVGIPPLRGPFVLAGPGDVSVENVEKDIDGMVPRMNMDDAPGAPMIVAPLALAKSDR